MNSATLGFVRGIGTVVLFAVVAYFADAAHLNGIVSPAIAAIVASLALSFENYLAGKSDKALFGAVKKI